MIDDAGMVPGDYLGGLFPTSPEQLEADGAAFLTEAFHRAGTLPADNRVTAVTSSHEVFLGGMGRKLRIGVAYERADDALDTELFIKFQRDRDDPLRAVFGPWMAPEIRFALLSRAPDFPITVPRCYFADFHAASQSAILVTQCIAYGENGIEPGVTKATDYEQADVLERYQALTRAMARLAAHHRQGRFGDAIEQAFPLYADDPAPGAAETLTPERLREKMAALRAFAERYPQLFADDLGDPAFLQTVAEDAERLLGLEAAIRAYLHGQTNYVGLCHPNLNLDNGWFWRDEAGELQAGLLDWGNVGQLTFAHGIIGMVSCAETAFLREHGDDLIRLFVDEFAAHGGGTLDAATLIHLVKLTLPLMAVPWIVDIPALIEGMVPDLPLARDRFDPRIKDILVVRAQLQGLMVCLGEWRERDLSGLIQALAAGRPIDAVPPLAAT